jgi:glucan biosynthesis protein C
METAGGSARYNDLDALRAFAILVVIAYHSAVNVLPGEAGPVSGSGLLWFVGIAHDFQMPVFFIMSGFFAALAVARSGAGPFVRGRLRRIGIPLVVGWLLMAPVLNVIFIWGQQVRGGASEPITADVLLGQRIHHLWFLWYLLMYCAVVLAVRVLADRAPTLRVLSRRVFATVVGARWRLLVLVPLTAAMVWPARGWAIVVPTVFAPQPQAFGYYLGFFAFGWLLFGKRELLPSLRRGPVLYTLVALTASIAAAVLVDNRPDGGRALEWTKLATVVLSALAAWSAILALLGWFHRWFSRPNERVRYVSDASYFLYLGHLPLVVSIYYALTEAGLPVVIRVCVAPIASVLILLGVYDRLVRYTAVGRLLHGPRVRRAEPAPVPAAAGSQPSRA